MDYNTRYDSKIKRKTSLCVFASYHEKLLLDDFIFQKKKNTQINGKKNQIKLWPKVVVWPIAVFIFLSSLVPLTDRLGKFRMPILARQIYGLLYPFNIVNGYGLFAMMTTARPEIVVEGSQDGKTWLAYEFKYKPGDLKRRPKFSQPHQPRLDWQMWFAALSDFRTDPWFINFCVRLLEGTPSVMRLIDKNPFPDAPPKYIRAVVYLYHFTNYAEKYKKGTWWKREYQGLYCPVLSLKGGMNA